MFCALNKKNLMLLFFFQERYGTTFIKMGPKDESTRIKRTKENKRQRHQQKQNKKRRDNVTPTLSLSKEREKTTSASRG
jgi:hypothetical protein